MNDQDFQSFIETLLVNSPITSSIMERVTGTTAGRPQRIEVHTQRLRKPGRFEERRAVLSGESHLERTFSGDEFADFCVLVEIAMWLSQNNIGWARVVDNQTDMPRFKFHEGMK